MLLCFTLIMGLFVFDLPSQAAVYAEYNETPTLVLDGDNYIYQTYDVLRTSDFYYHTIGFEISRIKKGVNPTVEPYVNDWESLGDSDPHVYHGASGKWTKGGKQREYYILNFDKIKEYYEYKTGDGHQICTYVIPKETLFAGLESSGHAEWKAELEEAAANGQPAYLGIDCIMVTVNKGMVSGSMTASGVFKGKVYDWSNYEKDLIHGFGWSKPETKTYSIPSHYHNYFVYSSANPPEVEEPPEPDPEVPDMPPDEQMLIVKNEDDGTGEIPSTLSGDSYSAPDIRTYNTSDTFDLGIGIPSSESYTNGISNDSWYGSIRIGRRTAVKNYEIPYKVSYLEKVEHHQIGYSYREEPMEAGAVDGVKTFTGYNIPLSDGYYQCQFYYNVTTTIRHIYTGKVVRSLSANYYYISRINLYEMLSSSATNNASGTATYNTPAHISYEVSINGNTAVSGDNLETDTRLASDISFRPDGTYHTVIPEVDTSKIEATDIAGITDVDGLKAYVEQIVNERMEGKQIETKSDVLRLNGVTYLDENGCYIDFVNMGQHNIGPEANDKVTGEQVVTIPEDKDNGKYYTKLQATYKQFIYDSMQRTFTVDDTRDSSTKAILSGYEMNEPVVVHSPVISPISINGEQKTQLVEPSVNVGAQLILDHSYKLKFDWQQYFQYKGYDNPAGFTKYVKDKQLRFPFTVQVNGTIYEPDATGYTQWISVGVVEDIDIYIPTWCKEGVYGADWDTGYNSGANSRPIQAKVFANNSSEVNNMEEYEYNGDLSSYVAVYDYPVEISGIMYDFNVVGINDELVYEGLEEPEDGVATLTENKGEKRVGLYNRFAEKDVRTTLDGSITNDWESINTLPFTSGKSPYFSEMGYLMPGNTIGFTLKTISNLYNGDDTIAIKPTYRYVATDGTVSDVDVYYNVGNEWFIKSGSDQDKKHTKSVFIGDLWFNGSLYDYSIYNPIKYTAEKLGIFDDPVANENYVTLHETDSYNAGNIKLSSTQKLLTGNEELLAANKANSASSTLRYDAAGLGTITEEQQDAFESSMQTWYGMYQVPSKLFVCDKGTDIWEYADNHNGLTTDADIWKKDGYLVLNFEIVSYVNGQYKHLAYYDGGGNLDMWTVENGNVTERYADVHDISEVRNIKLQDGDVGIISLESNFTDRFSPGVLYIN